MKFICAVLFFCAISFVNCVNVEPCSDTVLFPDVKIKGCEENENKMCIIRGNSQITIELEFVAPQDLERIRPELLNKRTTETELVTYTLVQRNACDGITSGKCPIRKGEKVKYSIDVKLNELHKEGLFDVFFSILDPEKADPINKIVCFKSIIEAKK